MNTDRGTVLTVPNFHVEDCGKPPDLVAGKSYNTYYFENEYGEQLVFQYDRDKNEGILRHGDYGWENPVKVFDGKAVDLILADEERVWLGLVWEVATRQFSTTFSEFAAEYSKLGQKEYQAIMGEFITLGFVEFVNDDLFRITEEGIQAGRNIIDKIPLKDKLLVLLALNELTADYFDAVEEPDENEE